MPRAGRSPSRSGRARRRRRRRRGRSRRRPPPRPPSAARAPGSRTTSPRSGAAPPPPTRSRAPREPPARASSGRSGARRAGPRRRRSQDSLAAKPVEVIVGKPEEAAVDLAVVAPLLPGRRPADAARRLGELRHDARADVLAEVGILLPQQHVARLELLVPED